MRRNLVERKILILKFLINSDDEAFAFYTNNRAKKFFKKPFSSKSKTGDVKEKFVTKTGGEEKKKSEKSDVVTSQKS